MRILAHRVGDSGIGLFAELREIQRIVVLLGTFGGGQAIIQGIASRTGEDRTRFSAEVLKLELLCFFVLAVIFILCAPIASRAIFGNEHHTLLLIAMIGPVLAAILMGYAVGMINGRVLVAAFAICQTVLAVFLWIFSYSLGNLAAKGNEFAYPLLLTIPFLASALFGAFFLWKDGAFVRFSAAFAQKIKWFEIKIFLQIAGAMLISQVLAAIVILALRTGLIRNFNLAVEGHFDSAWTVSMVYLTGIQSAFNVYYFPKLSANNSREYRQDLTKNMMAMCSSIMVVILVLLVLTRGGVINHLYGNQFLPATKAMRWMLIGDLFRSTGLFPTVLLIGRNFVKEFIILEVLMNLLLLVVGFFGLYYTKIPLDLLGIAYAGGYLVRLVVSVYFVRKLREFSIGPLLVTFWMIGLAAIVVADLASWTAPLMPTKLGLASIALLLMATSALGLIFSARKSAGKSLGAVPQMP